MGKKKKVISLRIYGMFINQNQCQLMKQIYKCIQKDQLIHRKNIIKLIQGLE